MRIVKKIMIEVYYVCRQDYEENGKVRKGDIKFLTIDNGWSELEELGAVFRECHATYLAEKHRVSLRDYRAGYSIAVAK